MDFFADQFGISLANAEQAGWSPTLYTLDTDIKDAQQVAPYQGGDAGAPWWQNAVLYGAVRAIDNAFGAPASVYGNTNPGTFAGQNGQSYIANGRPQPVASGGLVSSLDAGSGGLFGLVLIGAVIFVVVKAIE